jgi:ubiquinone/menaquinone biosynthesis C-methylase UbiE
MPTSGYDAIAPTYDAVFTDAISRAENRVIFTHLRDALFRCPGVTLDLGCGTGLFLEELPVGPEAYLGLDCSPAMLAQARQKFPQHRFALGTMAELPCPDRSVALVVSTFGSFCYCPAPARVIAEAWRVLQPGGTLFLMCYTPGYQARPDYVFNQLAVPPVPASTWSAASLAALAWN